MKMNKKVLIVEDSRTQMERLRALIEKEGYEVQWAGDGQEALTTVTAWLPDMVITDIVMPRINGYELCVRLRSDPGFREIPIIMLTSKGEPIDIIKGLEAGADNFITKPYEDVLLLGRMQAIFAEQAGRRLRKSRMSVDLELFGRKIVVTPERLQIVELLLSTMEELALSNQQLRDARREADRANQAKSEFLSRMSHELRTPLNAILGFGQLLEMDSLNPEQHESVEHILNAGRHLLDLINEVLDIARIEAGRPSISSGPVLVREALQEALELIKPMAAERKVQLTSAMTNTWERYVLADRQRLKEVLLNLLSNAVKYNHEGGAVILSCGDTTRGQVRINVRDTGPGIPPDKLGRLFTPFDRLGVEKTGVQGTGLGLALSKRLIELMGGEIGLDSAVGQGTTFWVELPLGEGPVERPDRMEARTGPQA